MSGESVPYEDDHRHSPFYDLIKSMIRERIPWWCRVCGASNRPPGNDDMAFPPEAHVCEKKEPHLRGIVSLPSSFAPGGQAFFWNHEARSAVQRAFTEAVDRP